MERQPSLTYEEVCQTAELLHRQGRNVTIDALHGLLGRGSKTTIHKYRERWRRELQRADNDADVSCPPAPDPLRQFFEGTFSDLWQAALQAAHEALAELRAEAERAITNAQQEVQKAVGEAESTRREAAMLAARVTTLDDKLEHALSELGDERQQRTAQEIKAHSDARAAAERIAGLKAALTKANLREAELNDQMKTAVTELQHQLTESNLRQSEAEREARISLEAMQREAAQREQALRRGLKLAQNRAKMVSVAWYEKEKGWIELKSKLEEKLEAELKESSRLGKTLARTQSNCNQLEERAHTLDRERVGLEKTATALRDQLSKTQVQLAKLQDQVQGLLRDNARLSEKLSQATKGEKPNR